MESEILDGIMVGLERLYTTADGKDISGTLDSEDNGGSSGIKDDQDGEAELGKMLVVVVRIIWFFGRSHVKKKKVVPGI